MWYIKILIFSLLMIGCATTQYNECLFEARRAFDDNEAITICKERERIMDYSWFHEGDCVAMVAKGSSTSPNGDITNYCSITNLTYKVVAVDNKTEKYTMVVIEGGTTDVVYEFDQDISNERYVEVNCPKVERPGNPH